MENEKIVDVMKGYPYLDWWWWLETELEKINAAYYKTYINLNTMKGSK